MGLFFSDKTTKIYIVNEPLSVRDKINNAKAIKIYIRNTLACRNSSIGQNK
jgi:hypothetical protein